MRRWIVLAIAMWLIADVGVRAQQPDWLLKIPNYYRLKGGGSTFCVDPTRNTVLFDGGAVDTYASTDSGRTWRNIFDIKMFYIDNSTTWMFDQQGRWYYEGRVFGKIPVNLVSEDGGDSLRYLIADTGYMAKNRVWGEEVPRLIQPNTIVFDFTARADAGSGIYYSTNAGRSFTRITSSGYIAAMYLRPVKPGVFALADFDGTSIEVDATSGATRPTDVSARMLYVRLRDETVVQGGSGLIQVRAPGDTAFTVYTTYRDPVTGESRPAGARFVGLVNDTLALILGQAGETFVVGPSRELRVLNAPAYRTRYQSVIGVGIHGHLLITLACVPEGTASAGNEFTVYDVRTGQATVHRHPGYSRPSTFLGHLNAFQIVPLSETEWLASFTPGEFVRTTNAGASWQYMDDIDQDPQWGEKWVGLSRLFPRGDGTMAVLTDRGRLMLDRAKSGEWEVVLPGPFTHRIGLPEGITDVFTRERVQFSEDLSARLRHRFGPSTTFFPTPDVMWVSGDALTSYTKDGTFIDTVLHRKVRYVKRISPEIIAAAMDSLYFSFNDGKEWVYVGYMLPTFKDGAVTARAAIGDLVVADNGDIIAGLRGMKVSDADGAVRDSIPGGLMVSRNDGNTWLRTGAEIDPGLYVSSLHKTTNGTLLCAASEIRIDLWDFDANGNMVRLPESAQRETIFKFGRTFLYRSTDHGRTWTHSYTLPDRERLGPTDVRFAAMPDGRVMVIHPTYGVLISADHGQRWSVGDPLNIGNPVVNDVVFTDDGHAHFATDLGYVRVRIENIVSVAEQQPSIGDLDAHMTMDGRLRLASDDEIRSFTVSSLDGRIVSSQACQANTASVDASAWPRGAYMVAATTATGMRRALVIR